MNGAMEDAPPVVKQDLARLQEPVVEEEQFLAVVGGDRLALLDEEWVEEAVAVLDADVGVVPVGAGGLGAKLVDEVRPGRDRRA